MYAINTSVTYFDSFGVEHIPKEVKEFIDNKIIKTNIFRIKASESIMHGDFCIEFIDFMLAGKTLTKFMNLFSPNNFRKNDENFMIKLFYEQYLKMGECNSHCMYPNLSANISNGQQFRLNKINEIKHYFVANIREILVNILLLLTI